MMTGEKGMKYMYYADATSLVVRKESDRPKGWTNVDEVGCVVRTIVANDRLRASRGYNKIQWKKPSHHFYVNNKTKPCFAQMD
jgi:hypothetical protein